MIRLGTKAETLERIRDIVKKSKVLPQFYFTVWEWENNRKMIFDELDNLNWFSDGVKLVVRSSALNEDKVSNSMAGKYKSLLNIEGERSFELAVQSVIKSYADKNINNQILIQPMMQNVDMSGVAFTLDPNTCGNYYVINYDDVSGLTDTITSGNSNLGKVVYCFKDKTDCLDSAMKKICKAFNELEKLFEKSNLDIEFVLIDEEVYILQIRELYISGKRIDIGIQKRILSEMREKVRKCNNLSPLLLGDSTIFGQMPDWNISEVLGIYPKPLSLSIFCKIAAHTTWSRQRNLLGYKNVQGFPLLIEFSGIPYVNVQVSFNSLLPADLSDELGNKLINYYLYKLKNNRDLHDKVEFDILYTCYVFDTKEKISELRENNFNYDEINSILSALKKLTANIISDKTGVIKKCYSMLDSLKSRNKLILNSTMDDVEKIYWLIEDCKEYGIPAFVGLARVGFIASQLLKSMINMKYIRPDEYEKFMNSIFSVNKKMSVDFKRKSKEEFLNEYGFLRPGTYDITSERYDENPNFYFNWEISDDQKMEDDNKMENKYINSLSKLNIERYMNELNIVMTLDDFLSFVKKSIEGREISKFYFTKNVSDALKLISKVGKIYGFTREECSYIDINIFETGYYSCRNIFDLFKESIESGKRKYDIERSLKLPLLILNEFDLIWFKEDNVSPNFITDRKAIGKTKLLKNKCNTKDLEGKILLIPYADPGYDWIFTHKIFGFITQFGGINSHMAIRAYELGIPCVLGVGEVLFNEYCNASIIKIDAGNKKVEVVS